MPDARPRFEVADVVRAHGEQYRRLHAPSPLQAQVLTHIESCRTAALGGHLDECDGCGYVRISYNSCRDRHCPKCQASARAEWLEQRLSRLLPVPYFHVVFTLPAELHALALGNKRVVYDLLFAAASQTLLCLGRDGRHLGAQIGVTAVLHTWGQNLLLHPHLHCVVTGGGLSMDGKRWVAGRERYFLPVQVLGRLFRGKFLHALQQAFNAGRLHLRGSTADLADEASWDSLRDALYRKEWVVYAKPPFGGPEQVFRYLGRYTHRVAISNHRLVEVADGTVAFTLKDYADGGQRKTMTLQGVEFLRRFLLHVLPKGFVRIRHFGLCASANVRTKLARAQEILASLSPDRPAPPLGTDTAASWSDRFLQRTGIDVMTCPGCGERLIRRETVLPARSRAQAIPNACPRAPPRAAVA